MSRAGRKRKPGRRTKSGQLSRAGRQKYDYGCEGVQRRAAAFGSLSHEAFDAIGRAYATRLLGDEEIARTRLTTARGAFKDYWAVYGSQMPKEGPLARFFASNGGYENDDNDERREGRVNRMRDVTDAAGMGKRIPFDELVLDWNIDTGPAWLDRLIVSDKDDGSDLVVSDKDDGSDLDKARLQWAIEILDELG